MPPRRWSACVRLGSRFASSPTRPCAPAARFSSAWSGSESRPIPPSSSPPHPREAPLRGGGLQVRALVVLDELREDLEGLEEKGDSADAVIVGDLGDRWDYEVLNRAFRRLMDGAALIALQKNRYWETAKGLSLDAGPFVSALEYATGLEAEVMGKPSAAFFELALGELGVSADHAAMVGDDVEADVAGAMDAGLAGILVTTGKYREDLVRESGIEPTAVADSIADVPRLLSI